MLRTLRIRELVLIEDLTLEFGPGFNVLTGETGAGKSILVDAVGLAVGDRADRSLIRRGADRAIVEAEFEVDPRSGAAAWLRDRGYEEWVDEGTLVVRREIPVEGSARVSLNGSPGSRAMLAELGPLLLELHGQHEFRNLMSPDRHLELLDTFGGHDTPLSEVREAFERHKAAGGRLAALLGAAAERGERLERLGRLIREIEGLDPRPGELEELSRERRLLRNAAEVSELLDALIELTHEGEPNAATLAHGASRRAERLARIDPGLEELAARLAAAAVELQDAGEAFRDYRDRGDFDPARLEAIESRRAEIERLMLRLGCEEEELPARLAAARDEHGQLSDLDAGLARAEAELAAAAQDYVGRAAALRAVRERTAKELSRAVERQFRHLALERARFEVRFLPAGKTTVTGDDGLSWPVTARGAERAEFELAANPGEALRPLARVASGGELSRVMLAIHAASGGPERRRSLVFDEIDAGIGGAVADAVGQRLAGLAESHQVLSVTHLPQVAAWAEHHFTVRKSIEGKRTRTDVERLDRPSRVGELARMLGGRKETATSRRHAEELLRTAAREPRAGS